MMLYKSVLIDWLTDGLMKSQHYEDCMRYLMCNTAQRLVIVHCGDRWFSRCVTDHASRPVCCIMLSAAQLVFQSTTISIASSGLYKTSFVDPLSVMRSFHGKHSRVYVTVTCTLQSCYRPSVCLSVCLSVCHTASLLANRTNVRVVSVVCNVVYCG